MGAHHCWYPVGIFAGGTKPESTVFAHSLSGDQLGVSDCASAERAIT
jgi:hypothetical protein